MKAGRLTRTPSAKVRGRALVDLMKGLQLRAKAGIASRAIPARRPKLCAADLANRSEVNSQNPAGFSLINYMATKPSTPEQSNADRGNTFSHRA